MTELKYGLSFTHPSTINMYVKKKCSSNSISWRCSNETLKLGLFHPAENSVTYENLSLSKKRIQDQIEIVGEFKTIIKNGGFVKCGWDGQIYTENQIKKETKATIRCIPFSQNIEGLKCIYSNEAAKYEVLFGHSY